MVTFAICIMDYCFFKLYYYFVRLFELASKALMTRDLLQQKLVKKDGASIDRHRDIEHLWEFYNQYKRRHKVDDIQREQQKWRESGVISANLGEYCPHPLIKIF